MHEIINQLPSICFWKDNNLTFRGINEAGLKSIGLHSPEDVIGLSDFNLSPFQNDADQYAYQDKLAMEGVLQFNLSFPLGSDGQRKLHLIHKAPLLNEYKKVIGVIGTGFDLNRHNFKNILRLFASINFTFQDFSTDRSNEKIFHYEDFHFSKREAQIVSMLLKGKTIKNISKKLNLSPRTVEHYITTIKYKTNSSDKEMFISQAFELGFIELLFAAW